MELRQLQYVVAVAETTNFTRAAERCFVVQSALSQQIRRLEEELSARLFDRTSRSVRLTAAGEAFLPVARRMVADAERARSEVSAVTGLLRGRLAIGKMQCVPCIDIPALVAGFHARHSGVDVSMREDVTGHLLRDVRTGVLDLAVVAQAVGEVPAGLGHLEIRREGHVALVSAGHPLADQGSVGLDRLASEVFVDFAPGSGLRAQVEQAFSSAGLTRRVAFEVTSLKGLARFVALGLGVALVPRSTAEELAAEPWGNHRLLDVAGAPRRSVLLVWREHPSPAARTFKDLVTAQLGSRG